MTSATSSVFSLDCLLNGASLGVNIRTFFLKLISVSLSPIIFGIITVIVWMIIFTVKYKGQIKQHLGEIRIKTVTSVIIIIFLLQTTII